MEELLTDEDYISDLEGNSSEPYYAGSEETTEFLANQKQQLIDMVMTSEE